MYELAAIVRGSCRYPPIQTAKIERLQSSVPRGVADFIVLMLSQDPEGRPTARECHRFFLEWHIQCNARHLPSAHDIRTPDDYAKLTDEQRRQAFAIETEVDAEDPLRSYRFENNVRLNPVKVKDAVRDKFTPPVGRPAYLLPE